MVEVELKKIQVNLSSCYKFLLEFWLKDEWKLVGGDLLTLIGRWESMKIFEEYRFLLIRKLVGEVRGIHSCILEESSSRCWNFGDIFGRDNSSWARGVIIVDDSNDWVVVIYQILRLIEGLHLLRWISQLRLNLERCVGRDVMRAWLSWWICHGANKSIWVVDLNEKPIN